MKLPDFLKLRRKGSLLRIIFFLLFISLPFLGLFLGFWLGVGYSRGNKDCVSLAPPEYKLVKIGDWGSSEGEREARAEIDLNNDGEDEMVHVYNEKADHRLLPVILKVFSGESSCLKEELFSYGTFEERRGNELGSFEVFDDFWGDGGKAVMFTPISTGYGSGHTEYMNFLTFKGGRYQVIEGPTLSELTAYMFLDEKNRGKQILVADAKSMWTAGEGHFDPHRCSFERWDWNGRDYVVVKLGETKNKYDLSVGIEEIIQAEPEALLPSGL